MAGQARARLSALMFLQYFVWGAWFVTLGAYMSQGLGFDAIIGQTYGAQGIAAIVAPLFVGALADRFAPAQLVLGALHLMGAGVMAWAATITGSPTLFFWVILAYLACYMPTIPLSNAVCFHALSDTERQFPAVRVLGTIGWIAAGLAVGSIPGAGVTNLPMLIAAGASAVLGLYCFTLPNTPPQAKGEPLKIAGLLGLDVLGKVKDSSFWVFIICSMLIVVPLSFYYAYTNTFLVDVGAVVTIAGARFEPAAIQTLGQMSEILFLLLLPLFFARFGIRWVLVIGMAAWALRYLAFAFGFDANGAILPLLLLGIALHGICFDFFFVAGQIHVDKSFGPADRARAQAFLALMTWGVGNLLGSNLAGLVYNANTLESGGNDWRAIWLMPAALALGVTLVFLLAFRARSAPPAGALRTAS